MKPTELRLGNWINTIEGPAQIMAIQQEGLMRTSRLLGDHLELAVPIPLTIDLLHKICLNEQGYAIFLGERYKRYTIGRISLYSVNGKAYIFAVNDQDLCEIEYLHQLQNLFFALTGEELTIDTI